MRNLLALAFTLLAGITATAQNDIRYCGQTEQTQKLFERFPALEAEHQKAHLESIDSDRRTNRGGDEIMIVPVVFHVIHVGGEENISDEQIYSCVDVLNEDFRLLNNDVDDIVPEFADIAADIGIEFRLAQLDPDGNCTKGITRIFSDKTYDGDDDMKELIQWPRNEYMNVWICIDAAGSAGYTFLPGSVNGWQGADEDGIVMRHDYTGRIGTSTVSRSRTISHEVGHWLNLYHTWGPGNSANEGDNCDIDDAVGDTPETIGWFSCNLSAESCGSLDNVQNYMDYAGCRRMFTEGQSNRMRTALQSSTAQRNQLWTESNLQNTGVWNDQQILCDAEFSVDKRIVCVGEEIQFTDLSYHGVNEWTWDFGNGEVLEGDDAEEFENPQYTYPEPGTYSITLTVGNGEEWVSSTVEEYITVMPPGYLDAPLVEGFEEDFPSDEWFVENYSNDEAWTVTDDASYSGDKSLKILNNSNQVYPNYDEIITATFDMSAEDEVYISYKWAHVNRFPATDDRLRVSVSPDCGESWYLKKIHRGLTDLPTANATNLPWTPSSSSDWTGNTVLVNIADQLTETFQVKFELEGRGGNNLFLDDINISTVNPVGIESINIADIDLQIWPNPAGDQATLRFATIQNVDVDVFITDIVGKRVMDVFSGTTAVGESQFILQTNELSAGTYFVNMVSEVGVTSEKLVVR